LSDCQKGKQHFPSPNLKKGFFFFEILILELAQQINPPALHSPLAVNQAPVSLARQQNSLKSTKHSTKTKTEVKASKNSSKSKGV